MPPSDDVGYFRIAIRGNGEDYFALADLAYFMHDSNLLYEFSRIIVDPKYAEYQFSRFSTYRNRYRIDEVDMLRVERLRIESPLELIAVVAAFPSTATAIWVLVQAVEKIANFHLRRDILKLNREKLRRELEAAHPDTRVLEHGDVILREQLRIREAEYLYDKIEEHLQKNPIHISEIDVTYIRELPVKRRVAGEEETSNSGKKEEEDNGETETQ
jgi:hypothetical protein